MSDIYLSLTETPAVVTLSQPVISGALSSTVTVANTVTVALDANSLSALEQVTVTVGAAVSISNFPATQTVAGTVTVGNSVTIGSLPAISGTVTVGNTVTVAGTVTANPTGTQTVAGTVTVGNTVTIAGTVTANPTGTQTIAGTVTAVLAAQQADENDPNVKFLQIGFFQEDAFNNLDQYHAVSDKSPLPVINKTANLPSGALTTRFGSVTTANTAQLTSAVTNFSRKYLLLQNISTGAVTVGVGFVPTTTQGIALAAGAGLTFDAFCPTGAVHWLGATTGAAFTILEG
jgi:hypothetical protein